MEQSLKGIAKTAGRSREKETKKKPEGEAYSAAVITIRDKETKEDHSDERGRAAVQMLQEEGYEIAETMIISDEPDILKRELIRLADQCCVDLIITSGGTGFAMRDRTPEITMEVADRNAPGIAEYIRMRSMEITDKAMLGRGVSAIRKRTLIINLPGSTKAVRECLYFIFGALGQGLKTLRESAPEYTEK